MNIEEITNSIKSKLGDEESGKIADDLANLLIYEKTKDDTINDSNNKIKKLQEDKDLLVQANANLLGKIPMGKADEDDFGETRKEENPEYFDYRTVFKDGRFKR